MTTIPITEEALEQAVLAMYDEVATAPDKAFHFWSGRAAAERFGYGPGWLDRAPREAVDSFAGVGSPHSFADLAEGQTVVDLGSGAGLDTFIAAGRVGERGRAIGVDMNDTMLAKSRELAESGGYGQVEFLKGRIEAAPVADGRADWVISNGVINLSFRKKQVMKEALRVLKPGGCAALTDVVSEAAIPQSITQDPKLWASWIGGALPASEFARLLEAVGFVDVVMHPTEGFAFRKESTQQEAARYGVTSATFTARKPAR